MVYKLIVNILIKEQKYNLYIYIFFSWIIIYNLRYIFEFELYLIYILWGIKLLSIIY